MKKYLTILFIIALALISFSAFGFTTPPAPEVGYIADNAGKLSHNDILLLNSKIEQLKKTTHNEFGILIVKSIEDSNIDDIAYKTFNSWGIGQKGLDNGVLIVIAVDEHKDRIETGKGVGGEITDLQANDILKHHLSPYLHAGDFAGGLNDTLDALSKLMENRAKTTDVKSPQISSTSTPSCDIGFAPVSGAFVIIVLGIVAIAILRKKQKAAKIREDEQNAIIEEQKLKREALERQEEAKRAEIIRNTKSVVVERPAAPIHLPPRKTSIIPPISKQQEDEDARRKENYRIAAIREQEARQRDEDRRLELAREADALSLSLAAAAIASSFISDDDNYNDDGLGGFDGGSSGGGGSDDDW